MHFHVLGCWCSLVLLPSLYKRPSQEWIAAVFFSHDVGRTKACTATVVDCTNRIKDALKVIVVSCMMFKIGVGPREVQHGRRNSLQCHRRKIVFFRVCLVPVESPCGFIMNLFPRARCMVYFWLFRVARMSWISYQIWHRPQNQITTSRVRKWQQKSNYGLDFNARQLQGMDFHLPGAQEDLQIWMQLWNHLHCIHLGTLHAQPGWFVKILDDKLIPSCNFEPEVRQLKQVFFA